MSRIPRYIKRLQNNPNMKAPSLRKEFLRILLWGGGGCLIIYWGLGLAVNMLVPYIPSSVDQYLGKLTTSKWSSVSHPKEEKLKTLLTEIVAITSEVTGPFDVKIIQNTNANAMAYPGKQIVITTALLDEIESENEMAFILGHELGHFINRDHLKGLGRGLVFFAATAMLFGNDNALVGFFGKFIVGAQMRYSQQQEFQADLWGLKLLERKYGHENGAINFFERLADGKAKGKELLYYFSTHPHPEKRIKQIQEALKNKSY